MTGIHDKIIAEYGDADFNRRLHMYLQFPRLRSEFILIDQRNLDAESTTTRIAGGLDFSAIGGKRQGREVPQSLRVEPGAKHPVWKTQSRAGFTSPRFALADRMAILLSSAAVCVKKLFGLASV